MMGHTAIVDAGAASYPMMRCRSLLLLLLLLLLPLLLWYFERTRWLYGCAKHAPPLTETMDDCLDFVVRPAPTNICPVTFFRFRNCSCRERLASRLAELVAYTI